MNVLGDVTRRQRLEETNTMARLTEAERVLLRAVLYLLRDSQQRDQVEVATADESRALEIQHNGQRAEELLEDISRLLSQ